MLRLELVSKKRKPIKRYTFLAILIAFLLLFLVGSFGNLLGNSFKVAIMIVVALIFITSLYALFSRIGFINIPQLIEKTDQDIQIAKDWQRGTIKEYKMGEIIFP